MTDWPIGLSTGCFYHTSFFDVAERIRGSGISVLEICSSRKHLDYHNPDTMKKAADVIDRHGLEVFSFHAPFGEHIDISAMDETQRRDSLEDVLTAVRAAGMIEARYFVMHPGPEQSVRPPAEEYLHRLSHAAESLHRIAEECARQKMMLALENMLPHLLFGRMPDLFWLLAAIEHHHVGICLDTGHAFLGKALYPVIPKFASHLRMLHIADNHGTGDDHLPPGKGAIDWGRVVHALYGIHFTGSLIMEISGHEGEIPEARLREAVAGRTFLRNLCQREGL